MTDHARSDLIGRETILKLLTNEETARVSTAETAASIRDGAEYLDLQHIDQGILTAKRGTSVEMGHVVPRSAVSAATWARILVSLRH